MSQHLPVRTSSLAVSAGLHGLVAAILLLALNDSQSSRRLKSEEQSQPRKVETLVWYSPKTKLPDLKTSSARANLTRGLKQASQVLIAEARQGSKTEFVWQPSPAELPKEFKAPNLISIRASTPAAPAPTPPAISVPEPAKPLKIFVAPVTAPALVPSKNPVALPTPPAMAAAAEASVLPRFIPQPAAPSNPNADGKRDIASINLNSTQRSGPVPPGRRARQFSSAPETAAVAGSNETKGAGVPGLTARGNASGSTGARVPELTSSTPAEPAVTVAYRDVMSHAMGSSFSAPLRPGSRAIPAGIESRFHDRMVYTLVLPSPRLPEYSADWILWFSDPAASGETVSMVKSPIPEKKRIVRKAALQAWGAVANIVLAAVIDENGRVKNASVFRAPRDCSPDFAVADLVSWQFKPATRNGIAIPVDALIHIPFRRPTGSP